ncbi:hypothetical protein OROMI_013143 [Orobanche minor]
MDDLVSYPSKRLKQIKPRYLSDLKKDPTVLCESKPRSSQSSIRIGNYVDVISMLSGNDEMNYLVRNNGERVKVNEVTFEGKHILICCINISLAHRHCLVYLHDLIDTCYGLYCTREDFEMVVAITEMNESASEVYFNRFLLDLPPRCLIVPFEDPNRHEFLCSYLEFYSGFFKCLLVDIERSILFCGCPDLTGEHLQQHIPQLDFLTFFSSLGKSIWPVIRQAQKYRRPWGGKCPIAKQLRVNLPEYPDDISKMVSELKKSHPIEIGKSFDVISLLSCNGKMNYLYRNNNNRERVEIEEENMLFGGKYIMVCCFHVPIFRESFDALSLQALVTICSDLYSTRDDFEMVVVVKMNSLANYEVLFDHFLSGFPSSCLVVPFHDSECRDFICNYLDLCGRLCIECLILDRDNRRNVLHSQFPIFALNYGADAFPFSDADLHKFMAEDRQLLKAPKLEVLLGRNLSDVLYKTNSAGVREESTIEELSKKVVGLYLCSGEKFDPNLDRVYRECRARQLDFEIVLVYFPFLDCLDPEVYNLKMHTSLHEHIIHWWHLPFNNSVSRRLSRLTCGDPNKLVIVGPDGAYLDLYGGEVISCYGTDGYPFTREFLIQREMNRIRELTLESLLVYGSRDYVCRGSEKIAVADLHGRNILLYIDRFNDMEMELCYELALWYDLIKAGDPNFEVVFVRGGLIDSNVENRIVSQMPWLVCPFDPDHSDSVWEKIFKGRAYNTLVQIGKDGRVRSLHARDLLRDQGPNAFPFDDTIRKDAINQFWHMPNHDFMDYMV